MTDCETMLQFFMPESREYAGCVLRRLEPKYGNMSLVALNELYQRTNSAEQRAELDEYFNAITIYFS